MYVFSRRNNNNFELCVFSTPPWKVGEPPAYTLMAHSDSNLLLLPMLLLPPLSSHHLSYTIYGSSSSWLLCLLLLLLLLPLQSLPPSLRPSALSLHTVGNRRPIRAKAGSCSCLRKPAADAADAADADGDAFSLPLSTLSLSLYSPSL